VRQLKKPPGDAESAGGFVCVAQKTSEVFFDHRGLPDHRISWSMCKANLNDKTSEVMLFPEMMDLREIFVLRGAGDLGGFV